MSGCCNTCDTLILHTPQGIMASFKDDDGNPLDVFAQAVAFDDADMQTNAQEACWALYRYRMIDGCNPNSWYVQLRSRATLIRPKWALRFAAYKAALDAGDLTSTDQGYRDVSTGEGSDTTTTEREDIPATADASASQWLTDRTKTTTALGTTVTINHIDNSEGSAARVARVLEGMPNIFEDYAREFEDLFINRWAMP